MQKQKLRASQQLQQLVGMSHSQEPEAEQHNQIYQNNPAENTNMQYRLQLTPQQAAHLATLLPTYYSFQVEAKPIKRTTSSAKNIKDSVKTPPEVKKKPSKAETKTAVGKPNPSRALKGASNNRYSEEVENAVYQKYNAQKDHQQNNYDNVSQALRPCVRLLNLLKNSRTSWPFRQPVDPIALGIPHYTDIVKEPMDLSAIENNLRTNQYVTPTQFNADVSKIITNSYTFNSSNMEFTRITAEFEAYFRKITAEPGSELARGYSQTDIAPEVYPSKQINLETKKSKKEVKEVDYSQSSAPAISMVEKKELGLNIKKLPKEDMKGILDIVKEGTGKIIGEFDLKELNPAIIRKLQFYVKEKLNGDNRPKGTTNEINNENEPESSFEVSEGDESE